MICPEDRATCAVPPEYQTCFRCRHWDHEWVTGGGLYHAACLHPEERRRGRKAIVPSYDYGCEKWEHRPDAPDWRSAA
jgi:hypothetical protein